LAAFEAALPDLAAEETTVVAGSVDGDAEARATVESLALTFPVLFALPLEATATALTTFYETRRSILQATGFVVAPDRTIAVACYSTGPIGRLEPNDARRAIRFWKAARR
jgi:peroxiredoxin